MSDGSAQWIVDEIRAFVRSSANSMQKWDDEPAWAPPLVGYSSGADPLYAFYKEDIGDFYRSPVEFLAHKYLDREFDPAAITVVSWVLPQTRRTKKDHMKETHFPSERWARSRIFGEQSNVRLRRHIESVIDGRGIEAVSPMVSPLWKSETSPKYGFASSWSERHAAYAAGLGTFGLCDGLITAKGKAHRAGSVVMNYRITPTERPYDDPHAYCLFYEDGSCGTCIKRCPIGAVSEDGHDKNLCSKYLDMTRQYVPRHFGFTGYGCGFCQTDTPCDSGIPKSIRMKLAAERGVPLHRLWLGGVPGPLAVPADRTP